MSEAAAFAAWLGAAIIVLSDGRRGLALGLGLTTIGFAALAWIGGNIPAAAAIFVGGSFASIQRLRTGPDVWGVMPPGSTPRLVLSIGAGLVALWIATSVMTGPGAQLRFAALSVLGLMAARIVTRSEIAAVLTALAALALCVAMAAGISDTSPGPAPYFVAALIAIGASVIKVRETSGT